MPITEGTTDFAVDNAGRHAVSILGPDGNFYHGRGAKYSVPVTPPITAGVYTAGFVVGGIQTIAGAIAPAVPAAPVLGVTLEAITVVETGSQKAPLEFLFFNANPSGGAYNDHTAPTINSADVPARVANATPVGILTTDYKTFGGAVIATITPYVPLKPGSGTSLFVVAFTPGNPTFAGTSALTFIYWFS